jgi:hypothetical protein
MCFEDPTRPYAFPLDVRQSWFNTNVLTYSLLLLKVTGFHNDMHWSRMAFPYPLRQLVSDPNARVGDHERALHFAASPAVAHMLNSYGSHRLAVLPAPKVWDPVNWRGYQNRCWHSGGCVPLFCYDCEGVELDVVSNPDFRHDLKLSPEYLSEDFIHKVWQSEKRCRWPTHRK